MQDLLAPVFAPEAAFTVGDLNAHIKRVLQADPILCDIAVAGEISKGSIMGRDIAPFRLKMTAPPLGAVRLRAWASGVFDPCRRS